MTKSGKFIPPPPPANMNKVSVIIPTRNSENDLSTAIDSALAQDYPGAIEVIVADGSDNDATADMLRRRYPQVRVVPNPEHTIPAGLNRALKAVTGDIVVRCDTHSVLPPGYVERAVSVLARTGAANVGGRQHAVGTTLFERAVAMATTTFLGVGNARHRLGGPEGPTDTVYLGAWYRNTLESVDGFDLSLLANEDYELNWRLRQNGGVVWFDPALVVDYQPRKNLWGLARQYFGYGRWKSVVLRAHPASLKARQLAPPLLALGLIASAGATLAGVSWAALLPIVYLLTLLGGALAIGIRRRDIAFALVPLVLATIHLSWGIGIFLPPRRKKRTD